MNLNKIIDLQTINELSAIIDVAPQTLQSLSSLMDKNVYVDLEPKKRGGFRKICKPSRRLKKIQKAINKKILQPIPLPSFLHGAVKGKSTKTLALQHVGMLFVLSVDIKDFYPNIHFSKIFDILFLVLLKI